MNDPQPLAAQQAEVRFRQALVAHQNGLTSLPDELTGAEMEPLLRQRMIQTQQDMVALLQRGEKLSPFLEIGAERCQRSLVLQNDCQLTGIAADLSWDMLNQGAYYQHHFGLSQLPLRLCCDALHLPIASNALPFVFCYQTVHHFQHPWPLLRQIYRVLQPGGLFWVAEEPYQNRLKRPLYQGHALYSATTRQASKWKKGLDYFFAEQPCNERAFGIIENDDIPLSEWEHAFAPFVDKQLELQPLYRGNVPFRPSSWPTWLAQWPGGSLRGTVRKPGTIPADATPIMESLICPVCLESHREVPVIPMTENYRCRQCQTVYPIVSGILMLLPPQQRQCLYPQREQL